MASVSSRIDSSDRPSQCRALIQMGEVAEIDEGSHRSEELLHATVGGGGGGGPFGKERGGLTDGVKGTARGPRGDR